VGAFILGPLMDRFGFYRVLAPAFLIGSAMIATIGRPNLPGPVVCAVVLLAGVAIVGGQSGINAIAVSYYPTRLRATGVGWALGIGRAGSIAGPMIAAQFIAHHWTSEQMFLTAAIPAGLSALMIWRMAQLSARREVAPSAAQSGRS
jgi:AAHS family 4-hydroxybenzoate transporter-like MFS transporter